MENLDKISVHSIFFNAIKMGFNYQEAIENFVQFGDEVVVVIDRYAGKNEDDGTWDAINQLKLDKNYTTLKIIEENLSIQDPLWIGKLKNTALQNTKYNYKVLLDGDERVSFKFKDRWLKYGKQLQESGFKGYLVPSLDLYGDLSSIRWDKEKNFLFKWYLNLSGCYRGAIRQGLLPNGKVNIKLSDATELIDEEGNLIKSPFLLPKSLLDSRNLESYLNFLKEEGIYVFHLAYSDFEKKLKINKEIWGEHHRYMTGRETTFPVEMYEMFKTTFSHNLPLWWE